MKDLRFTKYFLIALLLIFVYLAVVTLMPVFKSMVLGFVLAFAFYPIYEWLKNRLKYKSVAAWIMVVLILIIFILPGIYIVNSLIHETQSAYTLFQSVDFDKVNEFLPGTIASDGDMKGYMSEGLLKVRDFIVGYAPDIIGSVAETFLGLFIMFFVMFYSFIDGKKWIEGIKKRMPLKKEYTNKLIKNTESITKAVLYGYILTAIIQGSIGGLIFWILGVSNPIFWGFIMIILAIIPFVGTPIVWLPAAIIELLMGHYVTGILLLILGFTIIMNVDNFLRPKLIGNKAKVHPVIILVGVLGGLSVFGFTGIILGPMILTLLMVLFKFLLIEHNHLD